MGFWNRFCTIGYPFLLNRCCGQFNPFGSPFGLLIGVCGESSKQSKLTILPSYHVKLLAQALGDLILHVGLLGLYIP